MNNIQPWLEIVLVLFGSIFGSYLAVRVELATIKEQIKSQGATITDHGKRIERLEDVHFRAD
jgi:hypothetical protein